MTDKKLRDALAAALQHSIDTRKAPMTLTDYADALLPVVRAYGDQRAAEALREAAMHDDEQPIRWPGASGQWLRAMADALAPADTPEAHRG